MEHESLSARETGKTGQSKSEMSQPSASLLERATNNGLGPLIIVSGPSGCGKSTVLARVLENLAAEGLPVRMSISVTTREPRPAARDSKKYHHWTRARFEQEISAGGFLELAEVHGAYYGTLREEVEPFRAKGTGVILEIDVKGAEQIRRICPHSVSIFLKARSMETLEQRLRLRGTESEEAIRRRLDGAQSELARAGEYDYQVVNDDLEEAVAQVTGIVRGQFERKKDA
jgi:guanylate kinase